MSLFNKIKSVFNSSSDDVPDAQTIYFKMERCTKYIPPIKKAGTMPDTGFRWGKI